MDEFCKNIMEFNEGYDLKWSEDVGYELPVKPGRDMTFQGSVDEAERALIKKIQQMLKHHAASFLKIFQIFTRQDSSGDSVSLPIFFHTCNAQFNLNLTLETATALFKRWDTDKTGLITMPEFQAKVIPDSFKGKQWVDEAYDRIEKEEEHRLELILARKKPLQLPDTLHKWRWPDFPAGVEQ